MKRKTAIILALLLPVQIIGLRIVSNHPDFVERWYSTTVYPFTSAFMRAGLGFIPVSLGDLLYALLVIMLLRWIILRFRKPFRSLLDSILQGLAVLSLLYACFNLFWGLNYYRPPLHKALEIKNDYTTEQLKNLTEALIERSNSVHLEITGNDSLKVDIPYSEHEMFELTVAGFDNLKMDFPELDYNKVSLKRSLYSVPLSYMGFNGYLNPLTGEGHVNTAIIPFKIPTTASHEVGHQLGFAAENEANFIACLATMNHPDVYFRYSGYTFALGYCLNEMYRRDPVTFTALRRTINPGILKNYAEVREFWEAHKNPFEPVFMFTYNSFLKANYQKGGIESYSYVVALLVNYFDNHENLL